ncbi:glycosyltransferase family 4 protein [Microlunatus parietis]|uniref:Glycosyltransferase involved in cell wall biosynthesis n=1 Tax=Microlunatus parietis TaxID=682979 RepID=A0A7Y9LEG9_9ACTN|nr:glycosyltransferase family 4 protein [Microlunatus parietis]NYE73036.1 glycosyltransferase involved in cell wall biosynthesis [Microlunatus parietis]
MTTPTRTDSPARPAEPPDAPGQHILIIVQNLPVPLDRRVWLECQALVAAGYRVSVICPKGPDDPPEQWLDGVHLYKYRPAPEARGLAGFLLEFSYSWLRTAWLSRTVWRRHRFTAIQACNPPDTYWLLAWLWRHRGVRFVFDQHDLNPELFLSRFGVPRSARERAELAGLRWLERMTYKIADRVIATNESYRRIAIDRGRRQSSDVTVVRSGPDTRVMRPVYPTGRRRTRFNLVYLGIMGPQDGTELIIDVMDDLVHRRGRQDIHATLLGFGDCLAALRRRTTELGLDDYVTFTGRADRSMIAEHLSAADVGLSPDLKTPLNDVSTMNKTMEYMAYALPSVAFDLVETRVSGGESVRYVESGDGKAFADQILVLLDDPELRADLGVRARRRVSAALDWRPQSLAYVGVYDRLFGVSRPADEVRDEIHPAPSFDELGRRYVDLTDETELRRFVRERTAP